MGSLTEEYHPKNQKQLGGNQNNSSRKWKVKMIVLVILTNLLTIYIFSGPSFNLKYLSAYTHRLSDSLSLQLINSSSTASQLAASHSLMADLHARLNSTNLLVQALLIELAGQQQRKDDPVFDREEVVLAMGPHKLPLGHSPRTGSEEIYPSVGAGCLKYGEELGEYMKYEVGGECPVDDAFAQRLMLRGCEPLPRRRCRPKSPPNYEQPTPFPECL